MPSTPTSAISQQRNMPLLAPATFALLFGFVLPLANLAAESFRQFTPGRVGSVEGAPFTFENYSELATSSFGGVLAQTFWMSGVASAFALLIAFPLAYYIVRRLSPAWRTVALGFMITLVMLSVLVKIYAVSLTFGSVGLLRPVMMFLDISMNGRGYIQSVVIAGLVHAIVPVAVLTLIGAVQNVDPRLVDAAQSLGAPAWKAHLGITVPLCLPALISTYMVALTYSLSAFVIPLVLGKGRVLFLSNIIYTRFSDIANYPSGAAVSIVMLLVSLGVIYALSLWQHRREARG